ncbi:MAG: F0F1 ATP synthase subunit A [Gemmatimonadota bacterium]
MGLLNVIQEQGEASQAGDAHGAADAGHGAGLEISEVPGFIEDHLADGGYIEFFGWHWDVSALLHMEPIQVAGLTLNLTPTRHTVFLALAAILCLAVFIPLGRAAARRDPYRAPSGFQNGIEALILYFRDKVVRANIGHGADRFAPLILTLFFFILFMNVLGLTPFGVTATGNLSVTAALAIIAFIVTEVSGFRELGPAGYAKTIFVVPEGLPMVLKPVMLLIMTPVEFLGKLTKPFALAVRLFANMIAGHTLLLAAIGMIFVYQNMAVAGGSVLAASALMVLELFVATLQAYIFAMLTSVFIGLIQHAH